MEGQFLINAQNIRKEFPGVIALDGVKFELAPGEVHALVGENGAGKSTFIKILSGIYQPDEGEIFICGKKVTTYKPSILRGLGVATVFQELSLIPDITVEENIVLGYEPLRMKCLKIIDHKKRRELAIEFLNAIGADINPQEKVCNLGVAQQQLVEIARVMILDPKIIIMDEPTDKLFGREADILYEYILKLKEQGKGIIYISHKMVEIPKLADRVTIFRDGKYVDTITKENYSSKQIIKLMAGRELGELFPKSSTKKGKEILRVESLSSKNKLYDCNLSVHEGEILGIVGLVGAGRTELAKAIVGITPASGKVYYNGQPVNINSPQKAVSLGIAMIPEDRKTQGLFMQLPVKENIVLPSIKKWIINHKNNAKKANEYIKLLRIRTPSMKALVYNLSGGNQQKVIIARWLCSQSKVYIFDEPTQGIDVGTKAEIYNLMNKIVEQGAGIIMISSEMKEILGISDRILTMKKGRIIAEFNPKEATQEEILTSAIYG